MTKIKLLERPKLDSARALTAMELNKIHFANRRTILTPELLAKRKPGPESERRPS